ncbi:four helix bundle protein [Pseudoalteromonas sp. SCQQ13]|uniref:four helix bundle protein n=1 Tax=Pseudoalteromonas sp. SCQQ13 TaxID=2792066 RepID=UPI0018CEA495|nr:four helix bundle protein [Pseudoalteromonas sp. SCQQ13]MBH0093528.1 four helix bundle protein [Pseudoalteromonas sp. SCQQ13]
MQFENLDVWQRSADLACEIYLHFKLSKEFGLKDQITRSALSISSNIAEGFERKTSKDYARFLSYSKGSCGELRSQVYIAVKIGEIEAEQADKWLAEAREISCMLSGLMKSIESW